MTLLGVESPDAAGDARFAESPAAGAASRPSTQPATRPAEPFPRLLSPPKIAWSHDGRAILIVGGAAARENEVRLLDAQDLSIRASFVAPGGRPVAALLVADDAAVVIGRVDGSLSFYDAASGKRLSVANASPAADARPPHWDALLQRAKRLILPASVTGTFTPSSPQADFLFDARKGARLLFDASAAPGVSHARVVLAIRDSSGRLLCWADHDPDALDDTSPLIDFSPPEDGPCVLQVIDASGGTLGDAAYRVSAGSFGLVTGTLPLAVPPNAATRVRLVGHNVPADAAATVTAPASGEVTADVSPGGFHVRRPIKVMVSPAAGLLRADPTPAAPATRPTATTKPSAREKAMPVPIPASIDARIAFPGDAGLFRFMGRAGSPIVLETIASRRGAPTDTYLQILHADGRPLERATLHATRALELAAPLDQTSASVRFPNDAGLRPGLYVYLSGEVVRLARVPETPGGEWGLELAATGGRRRYFETAAATHEAGEHGYLVDPTPSAESLRTSDLPTFVVGYENDDGPDLSIGRDSRLVFTPPATGEYIVKVTDARGFGGDAYVYRLTIRAAAPTVAASIVGFSPTLAAGAGKEFTVHVERIDGFDGPVSVDILDVPAGLTVTTPIVVAADRLSATGTIYAAPDAPLTPAAPAGHLKAIATASIGGKQVTWPLQDLPRPWVRSRSDSVLAFEPAGGPVIAPRAPGEPVVVVPFTPGKITAAIVHARRRDPSKPLTLELVHLPPGVYLSSGGALIPFDEGDTEKTVLFQCDPNAPDADAVVYLQTKDQSPVTSAPMLFRVRRMK